MKKSFLSLLVLMICFTTIFSLVSCGDDSCEHRDADDNSICDYCSESYADGKDVEDEHTHSYTVENTDDKYLATVADCEHAAAYYHSCECGEKGTTTFSYGEPNGHSFAEENVDSKYLASVADCEHAATYYYSCECGEKGADAFSYGEPNVHNFTISRVESKYLATDADCENAATYYFSCACGLKGSETFVYGDPNGHSYILENVDNKYKKSPATVESPAIYYKSCACGEASSTETFTYGSVLEIPVDSILLDKTSVTIGVGESVTLNVLFNPENTTDKTLTWTTADANVATVSNGIVTVVGSGKTTITASTINGQTASCEVSSKHTVVWKNWDGTTLETDRDIKYGTLPSYDSATPTKSSNEQYYYTFSGWSPEINNINDDITYTAQFTSNVNKYTVTWKNWDGTILETDTDIEYGSTPTYNSETPKKEADAQYTYTFIGWDKDVVEVTGDVVYTADFDNDINEYTVTWKNWDGTVLKVDQNVEYGTYPTYDGETPIKEREPIYEYKFIDWTPDVREVTGDVTYVALFEQVECKSYIIKYELNGGIGEFNEIEKEKGEEAYISLEVPTRSGYIFVGWNNIYEDNTYQPGDSFSLDFNFTLYAIWEEECLECGGAGQIDTRWSCSTCSGAGLVSVFSQCSVCRGTGTQMTLECQNCGYTKLQHGLSGSGTTAGLTCPRCYGGNWYYYDVELCDSCDGTRGKYVSRTCSDCGGQGKGGSIYDCTACHKTGINRIDAPLVQSKEYNIIVLVKIDGYQYSIDNINWQDSNVFEGLHSSTTYTFYQRVATKDGVPFGVTSYPVEVTTPAAKPYKIDYVLDGGSTTNETTYTVESDDIILSAPIKTGYTFVGWTGSNGATPELSVIIEAGSTGDLTYTAHWAPNSYTVIFDKKGGSGGAESVSATFDAAMPDANAPQLAGYNFVGYYDENGIQYYSASMESLRAWDKDSNTTLYARYEGKSFTVMLDWQDGTGASSNIDATYGSAMPAITEPVRIGYTFIGYFDQPNGKGVQYYSSSCTSLNNWDKIGDATLYAAWEGSRYEVTLDETAIGSYVIFGSDFIFSTEVYKAGYTFGGWYDSIGGTGTQYTDASGVSVRPWDIADNATLYPKWIANEYTITFVSNGGSPVSSITQDFGTTVIAPTNPTWSEKSFVGWFDSSLTTQYEFTTMPAGDITLYAKWIDYEVLLTVTEKTKISINDGINANTFGAYAVDTDGNPVSVTATILDGKYEIGNTITVRLVATGLYGIYDTKTVYGIRVYGAPTIIYDESKDYINISDKLDAFLFGASATDTYGTNLNVSVTVREGAYAAGGLVTIVLSTTDATNNEAVVEIENIKVYGLPTITFDKSIVDIKSTDKISSVLFGATADDSFGVSLDVLTEIFEGTQTGGNTITVKLSATDSKGNTNYITHTINVYGTPAISDATRTEFKVNGNITLEVLGIVAQDNFGKVLDNVTLELIEGVQEAGETLAFLVTATDHLGNIQTRTISDIKIFGTPEIEFNSEKIQINATDTINASLFDATAKDSFGASLNVSVAVEAGEFSGGNVVTFRISATDHLGNSHYVITPSVKVYSSKDIVLTYNAAAANSIKKTSNGSEFYASATNSFGENCAITIEVANGYTIEGGNIINLYLVATDCMGNAAKSALISGIKVYDMPTMCYIRDCDYIQSDDNPYALFSVTDSFGNELLFDVEIVNGSLLVNETIVYRISATDKAGNILSEEYELAVLDTNESIFELYKDGEFIGTQRVYKNESFILPCDNGYHTVWYCNGMPITENNGSSLSVWSNDSKGYTVTATPVPIEYSISYLMNDGTNNTSNPTTYNIESSNITLAHPTRTGYTFVGWTGTDLDEPAMSIVIPTGSCGDRCYIANWSLNTYTITYDLNYGAIEDGLNPDTYTFEDYIVLDEPTKELCRFVGWYCNGVEVSVIHQNYGENITLTAEWECIFKISGNEIQGLTSYGKTFSDFIIPEFFDGIMITSIRRRAFDYCSNLTSVTIPDSVTSIGDFAFNNCTSLSSVSIGNMVTKIGVGAFFNCTSLKNIVIPDCVTSIGSQAFASCISLTSVTIGNGVRTISERMFEYCTNLSSITIPKSVTRIGNYAFTDCTSLINVKFEDNIASWYYTPSSKYSDGTKISFIYDVYQNATNLKNKYDEYYWYKQ